MKHGAKLFLALLLSFSTVLLGCIHLNLMSFLLGLSSFYAFYFAFLLYGEQ